jgi:hypothetical protein
MEPNPAANIISGSHRSCAVRSAFRTSLFLHHLSPSDAPSGWSPTSCPATDCPQDPTSAGERSRTSLSRTSPRTRRRGASTFHVARAVRLLDMRVCAPWGNGPSAIRKHARQSSVDVSPMWQRSVVPRDAALAGTQKEEVRCSPHRRAGLRRTKVIASVNGTPTSTAAHCTRGW